MEELVGGHGGELSWIRLQGRPAQFDGGGVSMLHPAIAAILGKMEEEEGVLERTILHPGGLSVNDPPGRVGEAREIAEVRSCVNHDAVMSAILGERRFLELAEFDRGIDERVVIGSLEVALVLWKRRRHMPTVGDGREANRDSR